MYDRCFSTWYNYGFLGCVCKFLFTMKIPGALCASLREEEKALLDLLLKEKSTTAPNSRGKICGDCYQLLEIAEVGRSTFDSHVQALEMKQKRKREACQHGSVPNPSETSSDFGQSSTSAGVKGAGQGGSWVRLELEI